MLRKLALAVTTVACVATAVPAAGAHAAPQDAGVRQSGADRLAGPGHSYNWSGYVQLTATHQVSAVFRVPKVTGPTVGYAGTWVGIDGVLSKYLTQVGVEEDWSGGHATYFAWWEVITPTKVLPEQPIRMTIKPGQWIKAQVSVSRGHTTLTLANLSTKHTFVHTVAYAGPGKSADYVQEDVQYNGHVSPAPAWTPVSFSRVTRNNYPAKLQVNQGVNIIDKRGVVETKMGAPTTNGTAFTVTRLRAGHWTTP